MEIINDIHHSLQNVEIKFRTHEYYCFRLMIDVANYLLNHKKNYTIFGGFVRDLIFLQHQIRKFETEHPEEDFWDPSIGTLEDRLIIPKNIDVAYSEESTSSKKKSMAPACKEQIFHILPNYAKPSKIYETQIVVESFYFILSSCNYFSNKQIDCEVNFYIRERIQNIFYREDMECNTLCIKKDYFGFMTGTSVVLSYLQSPEKELTLARIIVQIREKTTNLFPLYYDKTAEELAGNNSRETKMRMRRVKRTIEMMKRGWKIENMTGIKLIDEKTRKTRVDYFNFNCHVEDCNGEKTNFAPEITVCQSGESYHVKCFLKLCKPFLERGSTIVCGEKNTLLYFMK